MALVQSLMVSYSSAYLPCGARHDRMCLEEGMEGMSDDDVAKTIGPGASSAADSRPVDCILPP